MRPARYARGSSQRFVRTWSGLVGVGLAVSLMVTACGSKTSETPGPSSGGSAGSGQCSDGDTRTCVGPGACEGGQVCGTDGRWSTCNCGPQSGGGNSGSGPAGGNSAAGSAGSGATSAAGGGDQGGGGTNSVAGGASDAGSAGEAGTGAMNLGDDPCPTSTLEVDCSGQCETKPALCDQCPSVINGAPATLSDGLVLVRTPSHPGASCTCDNPSATTVAYRVVVWPNKPTTGMWHVQTSSPWYPSYGTSGCQLSNPSSCLEVLDSGPIGVWTPDPNAPSINVTVQAGPCP